MKDSITMEFFHWQTEYHDLA